MTFFLKKTFESVKNSSRTSGLNKNLNAFDLILLGLGAIIGTGVFALTGLVAAQHSGPAVFLSYIIAGCTCIFVALAYTELASMLPTSGSVYTYSYVGLGQVFAWVIGSVTIIEFIFGGSAVAISWSAYMQSILAAANMDLPEYLTKSIFEEGGFINLPATLIVSFAGFMLFLGTKESKKLNSILVAIKITAIFIFVLIAAPNFDIKNWENFMPNGFDDVIVGAGTLFFAFTGFGILASTAEECKNPSRDLTIGIIGSLIFSTLIYVIVGASLTGIVSYTELNNAQPLAYALKKIGSNVGSTLVATGAIAGMTTVIMVHLYGQSRIFYAMARDGLLPKFLSKVHHKHESPHLSIMLITTVAILLSGFVPYAIMAKLVSMSSLVDYLTISIVVIIFRYKYPNHERPFKCPAIFIVAPIAVFASGYLLFKQIIGKNWELLDTGMLLGYWVLASLVLYVMRITLFKKPEVNN